MSDLSEAEKAKRLQDVGAKAFLAMEYFESILKKKESQIISDIKNLYRDVGPIEPLKFVVSAGVLASIDDIRNMMKSDIKRLEGAKKGDN